MLRTMPNMRSILAGRCLRLRAVFTEFRAGFIGKGSPVHFFWGSFDLAVTRFSGRRAPEREGADFITREAYSHEVISAGFWPGGGDIKGAAFYAYAAPEPAGFAQSPVRPTQAFYHPQLKEFILMYDDVRRSPSPRETLLAFPQSTYGAGRTWEWNRKELERWSAEPSAMIARCAWRGSKLDRWQSAVEDSERWDERTLREEERCRQSPSWRLQ